MNILFYIILIINYLVKYYFYTNAKNNMLVKKGDLRESNSRSLAPKASIIPLDQSPL